MKFYYVILLLIFNCISSFGQVGGESIYSFLRLNMSSNYASLGGFIPSADMRGVNSVFSNPALVDSLDNMSASLNYISYVSDINYGSMLYGAKVGSDLMITGGVEFLNYGDFEELDDVGNQLGTFNCKEHVLFVSFSRNILKNLRFGATFSTIFSHLETYRSFGIVSNLGLIYKIDNQKLTIGFSAMNLGCQLTKYAYEREKLPLDLRFGISKILLHAPLRFSFTLHDLQCPKLDDDFMRSFVNHIILSTELFPESPVSVKAGFNFQTHNDLYVSDLTPFPGFSFGVDVRLKRFSVQYSRRCLSPAASANFFTAEIFISNFVVR